MEHLIVGIDTGKTMAFACMTLGGTLVRAGHMASAGPDWLIDTIGKLGVPSIIACDREPGDAARKISAAFSARLFHPLKELNSDEKRELARKFKITNPHERDACAAAVKAYRAYANKLQQAEHIARRKNAEPDSIKAKVIGKYSIEEAISNKRANRK